MATYWENSCSFGLRYVSWYEYLIVSLVFSHLGFWSGNLFLIAPFPDLCLLVPFDCNYFIIDYSENNNFFYFKDHTPDLMKPAPNYFAPILSSLLFPSNIKLSVALPQIICIFSKILLEAIK